MHFFFRVEINLFGFVLQSPVNANPTIEGEMQQVPSSPLLLDHEPLSHASSVCSRKDSGIRSNSRRSSIQQQVYNIKITIYCEIIPIIICKIFSHNYSQLFLMNGMTQQDLLGPRVSGYYTSSSTLNSTHEPSSSVPPYPFPPTFTDTFGACFYKLRKQSDLQLIR